MNTSAQCAEIVDRTYKNIAFLILFLALSSLADTIALFTQGDTQQVLGYISKGFAILTLLVAVRGMWFMRKKLSLGKKRTAEHESFILGVFKDATMKSWMASWIFIAFLDNFNPNLSAEDMKKFVISAALAFMLGIFSLIFFLKNRGDKDLPEEDFAS